MIATVLFVAGMLALFAGVIVWIAGERSTGGAILLAGAVVTNWIARWEGSDARERGRLRGGTARAARSGTCRPGAIAIRDSDQALRRAWPRTETARARGGLERPRRATFLGERPSGFRG